MSRVPLLALVLVSLVGTAGCADNILKERPVTKVVAAATVAKPAFSVSGSAKGQSSVCAAYRRQLLQVTRLLTAAHLEQRKQELNSKQLSLNAVIADACE
jgi:hypothetical protein